MRRLDLLCGADRPIGGDPFAGGMGQQCREAHLAAAGVDPCGLDGCDLLFAGGLADKVQPGGQAGVAEGPVVLPREGGAELPP